MNRYDALGVIASFGVDIVPLIDESDAYLVAYAQARLDLHPRLDEWDPDQPRDEKGMFAGAGGGTVEGAVKSGQSAIDKAKNEKDLNKLTDSIGSSKVLTPGGKAQLYQALSSKAEELQGEDSDDAINYQHMAYTHAIGGEEGKDWVNVTDSETGDEVKAMIVPDGNGGQAAMLASGEVVKMPGEGGITDAQVESFGTALEDPGGGYAAAAATIGVSKEAVEQAWKEAPDKDNDAAMAAKAKEIQAGFDKEAQAEGKAEANQKDFDEMSAPQVFKSSEYKSLTDTQKSAIISLMDKDKPIHESIAGFLKANELSQAVEAAKDKPQSQLDHSKEAREAAKKIVQHAKDLREQYKKNPSPELKTKLEAAEKAAKAARSAARKAEKAKTPEEAKKHAEAAKAHHSKLIGGDEQAKAFVVSKAKPEAAPKGGHADLAKKAEKLKEAADSPHPANWSKEKVEAKDFAKETLAKYANASTPEELKAAAKAFDAVAAKASAAGSLWGHGYTQLAEDYRDKATPQEKFTTGEGGSGDHSTAPSKSARPIGSIQGEEVSVKTFKNHREEYTNKLTGSEKKAALRYSGSSYASINANLRADGKPTEHDLQLDKAIAKSPAPRDLLVHRGISGNFSKNLFAGMKPGDQFVEKAYSSTSAGNHAAFGGDVALRITVPKGYPIAPIPSHHPGENEYLMRRNTKFEVTKIEKSGDKIIAHVTVVHDKEEK